MMRCCPPTRRTAGNGGAVAAFLAGAALAVATGTNAAPLKSQNENIYDATYWKYQQHMNEFGGAFKGDVIKHFMPPSASSVLEFGSAGGYIVSQMPVQTKVGVEINPTSREHAEKTFGDQGLTCYERVSQVPNSEGFDMVYTTSVLEHVDCPLCTLRELKGLMKSTGRLVVGLRNDGVDPRQTVFGEDPNHHIYTWNELLMGNLIQSAGYKVCAVGGKWSGWHTIDVAVYRSHKKRYCQKASLHGHQIKNRNLWAIAVLPDGDCGNAKLVMDDVMDKDCRYLDI